MIFIKIIENEKTNFFFSLPLETGLLTLRTFYTKKLFSNVLCLLLLAIKQGKRRENRSGNKKKRTGLVFQK